MKKFIITWLGFSTLLISTAFAQDVVGGNGDGSTAYQPPVSDIPDDIRAQISKLTQAAMHGSPQFSIVGILEAGPNGTYSVRGESFSVNSDTIIYGDLAPGKYVEVRGDLVQDSPKVAKQIVAGERASAASTSGKIEERNENAAPQDMSNAR